MGAREESWSYEDFESAYEQGLFFKSKSKKESQASPTSGRLPAVSDSPNFKDRAHNGLSYASNGAGDRPTDDSISCQVKEVLPVPLAAGAVGGEIYPATPTKFGTSKGSVSGSSGHASPATEIFSPGSDAIDFGQSSSSESQGVGEAPLSLERDVLLQDVEEAKQEKVALEARVVNLTTRVLDLESKMEKKAAEATSLLSRAEKAEARAATLQTEKERLVKRYKRTVAKLKQQVERWHNQAESTAGLVTRLLDEGTERVKRMRELVVAREKDVQSAKDKEVALKRKDERLSKSLGMLKSFKAICQQLRERLTVVEKERDEWKAKAEEKLAALKLEEEVVLILGSAKSSGVNGQAEDAKTAVAMLRSAILKMLKKNKAAAV